MPDKAKTFSQGSGNLQSSNDDPAARLLAIVDEVARELHPRQPLAGPVTLDSSLDRELGLDSLGTVELLARVEKAFDVALPEQHLAVIDTVRDVLRAIDSATGRPLMRDVPATTISPPDALARDAVPFAATTLVEVLECHAAWHPDRLHIRLYSDHDDGECITYGALWQDALQLAAGLQSYGIVNGDRVLLMLPTGREYFSAFFAILIAGAIPVPVYPPGRLKQIEEHLRRHNAIAGNCLAKMMITMDEALRFAGIMRGQVESMRHVVTMGQLRAAAQGAAFIRPTVTSTDIAFLQYTSGSTGTPKGVVLTHANLLANIRAMAQAVRVEPTDVFVSWLPLYHDMGLIGAWLGSLHFGCQLVIMSPLAFIARPQRWLRAIHRFGGTLSAAPNFAYDLCVRRVEAEEMATIDLSSWRVAFNGAEAVNPSTLERFIQRFSSHGFRAAAMTPVYGLAESSVGLAFPPMDRGPVIDRIRRLPLTDAGRAEPALAHDEHVVSHVNCGRPLPGHQIRIVDASGREVGERQEGHLQFMGPSATSGYYRNPQQTARLFQGDWLDSGDMAYMVEGDVYITGRAKDIIIRAGRNIYPEELEEAVGRVEGVLQGNVAIFGSRDEDFGTERLVVLAETRKRQEEAVAAIRGAINSLVADILGEPADEVVLAPPNTVLKTSSGKIRRGACRALYESGVIGRPPSAVWLQVARFWVSGLGNILRRQLRRLAAALYAAWCWLLFGFGVLLVWPLVVFLPKETWRWRVVRGVLRGLSRLVGIPLVVQGREYLPPSTIPCVYVCNHASYLDSLLLAAVLPPGIRFVAKAELRRNFFLRLPLSRLATEYVERFDQRKSRRDGLRIVGQAKSGRPLLFFAEGTFTRMPGLLPFRMGAFQAAVDQGIPVVPVAIRGSRSILRSGSWFPRAGKVSVTIGPPLEPAAGDADDGKGQWRAALLLRDQARDWILRHCGEPDMEHERPAHLVVSGGGGQP